MVTGIEKFVQRDGLEVLKVRLSPTPQFPNGSFFYCEARDEDLVLAHRNWTICNTKHPYVRAGASIASAVSCHYHFHSEVAKKYLGYYPEAVDHFNGLEFDCVDSSNLFSVTQEQNGRNKRSKGYQAIASDSFRAHIKLHGKTISSNYVRNEIQALAFRNQLEQEYFSDYNYNFLADRRTSLDLLLQEREGILSHDDAVYLYLKKYSDNPWFYFRYDLAEAYDYYGFRKPEEGKDYWIDEEGFMIGRNGKRLVPVDWLNKRA